MFAPNTLNGRLCWLLLAQAVADQGNEEFSLLQRSASRRSGAIDVVSLEQVQTAVPGFYTIDDPEDALHWLNKSGENPSLSPESLSPDQLKALGAKASPLFSGKRVALVGDSRAAQFFCFFQSIIKPESRDDCSIESFWNEPNMTKKIEGVTMTYLFAPTFYESMAGAPCSMLRPSAAVAANGGFSAYDIVILSDGLWDMSHLSEGGSGWNNLCQRQNHTELVAAADSELSIVSSSATASQTAVVVVGPPYTRYGFYVKFGSKTLSIAAKSHNLPFVGTYSHTKDMEAHSLDGFHYDQAADQQFVEEILAKLSDR